MQKYFNTVANRAGAAIAGATITVKTQAGAFATLYADNGVTAKANPVRTDSNGFFEFYAADGRYNLTITGTGIGTQVINDVLIEDPADGTQSASTLVFQQSGTGAASRNVQDKLRESVTFEDFGAIGDGVTHPLSQRYASLALAQADYPFVTALTQEIDWAALTAAAIKCRAIGVKMCGTPGKTYMAAQTVDFTGIAEIDMAGSLIWTTFDGADALMIGNIAKKGAIRVAVRSAADKSSTVGSVGVRAKKINASDVDVDIRGYDMGLVIDGSGSDAFVKNRFKLRSLYNNGTQIAVILSGSAYVVYNDFDCKSLFCGVDQLVASRATVLYRLTGSGMASENTFHGPEIGITTASMGMDFAALFRGEIDTTWQTNSVYFDRVRIEYYGATVASANGVYITGASGRVAVQAKIMSKTLALNVAVPDLSFHEVDLMYEGVWAPTTRFDAVPVVPAFGIPFQSGSFLRVPNAVVYDNNAAAYGVEQTGIQTGIVNGTAFARGDGTLFCSLTNITIGRIYTKATDDTAFIKLQGGRKQIAVVCWDAAGNVLSGTAPYYVTARNKRSTTRGVGVYEAESEWLWLHKDVAKFYIGAASWVSAGMLADIRIKYAIGAVLGYAPSIRSTAGYVGSASPTASFHPVGFRLIGTASGTYTNRFLLETTASSATASGGTVLSLTSATGVAAGDTVGVETDELLGSFKRWRPFTVAGVAGTAVTLSAALPAGVSVGNAVLLNRWTAD